MENDKTKMCDRCGCVMNYNEDFCPECGIENFNSNSIEKIKTIDKISGSLGAWILVQGRAKNGKETNPPLFTKICTDDIKSKATGKRFCRGRYVLFGTLNSDIQPTLIEETDDYRIVYHKSIFDKIVIKD